MIRFLHPPILDIHEHEAMIAAEVSRQYRAMPAERRAELRREVLRTHRAIIVCSTVVAILLGCMVSGAGHWLVGIILAGVVVSWTYNLRTLCLTARWARLAGVPAHCPKSVPLNRALAQLSAQGVP